MTMHIKWMSELKKVPWKNGGGVTREIATGRRGEDLVWRLSMADVASDGPFSKFNGLTRILTVIEGNGMELISHGGSQQADYAVPVRFDGALEITSRLKDGPLRDLNLFFDPALCDGNVAVITDFQKHVFTAKSGQIVAIHCLRGEIVMDGDRHLQKGDTAFVEPGSIQVEPAGDASIALVTLSFPGHSEESKPVVAAR